MFEMIIGAVLGIAFFIALQKIIKVFNPEYMWLNPQAVKGSHKRLKRVMKRIRDHSDYVLNAECITRFLNRLMCRSELDNMLDSAFRDSVMFIDDSGRIHLVCFVVNPLTVSYPLDVLSNPKGWPSLSVIVTVVDLIGDDLKDRVTSRGLRYLSYLDFPTECDLFQELIKRI